jgi:hypothetical protein
MPTSPSAFAAIGEIIGQVDPEDIRAVDDFFAREFSSLDQAIQIIAFHWTASLGDEPDELDRAKLRELLDAIGFQPKGRANSTVDAVDELDIRPA